LASANPWKCGPLTEFIEKHNHWKSTATCLVLFINISESEVVLLRLSKHGHLAQVHVSVPHHAAENTAESQHTSINHFNSVKIQSRQGKIAYKLETPKFSGGKNMTKKKTESWWMFQGSHARQRLIIRDLGIQNLKVSGSQNDPCKSMQIAGNVMEM